MGRFNERFNRDGYHSIQPQPDKQQYIRVQPEENDLSTAPTSTGTYKKVHSKGINGGTGPANTGAGGQAGDPLEWVLKRNTKYVFAVNTTEAYGINFFWYEEDDA